MANYSLILDTKFKPFSYAEMLAPVAAATQAHQALEEEYANLATKANVWEEMANEQADPYAYKMYKTFSDDLEARAEQLMKYGLNASSRKGMLDMRARYSKEIIPIENAYKRREKLVDEQRAAMLSNPTLFYQRDAASMSLDDFIKNPSLDYGAVYSGALLAQQAGQIASNLKTALTKKGDLKSLGLQFQYERLLQYGYTPDQIEKAITNPKEGDPILTAIIDQVLESSGMTQWASPEQMRRARAFANQGLYNAIGQSKIDTFTDTFSMHNALNAAQYQRQLDAKKEEDAKMYNINPTTIYGESEVANMNRETRDTLNRWRDKGYINSKGQLTKRGWSAIKDQLLYDAYKLYDSNSPYVRGRSYKERDSEFKNWADKHGVQYSIPIQKVHLDSQGRSHYTYTDPVLQGYGKLTNYYNTTRRDIDSGKLVTGTPNIDVYRQSIRDKETRDFLVDKITAALTGGGKIYQVGTLSVTGKGVTMDKGEGISADDFKELTKDTPILHIINSPATNNQLVELTDGTKFILPKSILDNFNQKFIYEANEGINNSGSVVETATLLNEANSYLGSLLNYNKGTGVSTNDGMMY